MNRKNKNRLQKGQQPSFSVLIYLITISITSYIFTSFFRQIVFADTLTSPTFMVDYSTINITGGQKSSTSYKVTDTVGQTAQGQFNSSGYTIKAGFQYIYVNVPFSFRISNFDLNYGSLNPNAPSLLTNVLTVTTGSAFGYTVKAIEDHSLRRLGGSVTIPDTSCDLALTCTPYDATPWTDNARTGFGFNIQGTDVNTSDFVNNTYFRPFPIEGVDTPTSVMSRVGIATNSAATVTYKVNIDGAQAAGVYQNNITYIAIPAF